MIGAELLNREIVVAAILAPDVVADGFDLGEIVENVGDGLRELIKGDGI